MTRGAIRPTTPRLAATLAWHHATLLVQGADGNSRPVAYRLEEKNGGRDPNAPHCADLSYPDIVPTSDCIGLVLFCSGIDRLQPGYKGSRGEWLNCASLLDDADSIGKFCNPTDDHRARPGDWLVTRSHIAMIVRPAVYFGGRLQFDHLVIDCSPRHGRTTAVGVGAPWSDACRVLRPTFYVQESP